MPAANRPTRAVVLGVLLAAAVIGFLGGALTGEIRSGGRLIGLGAGPAATQTTPSASPSAADTGLTLESSVGSVAANGEIRLSGRIQPPAGVTLQVQRRLDGGDWSDFPVTTRSRDDGTYSTVVRSGRKGVNDFRVVTEVGGEQVVSPSVTVTIS
jgi:hypothetical protein